MTLSKLFNVVSVSISSSLKLRRKDKVTSKVASNSLPTSLQFYSQRDLNRGLNSVPYQLCALGKLWDVSKAHCTCRCGWCPARRAVSGMKETCPVSHHRCSLALTLTMCFERLFSTCGQYPGTREYSVFKLGCVLA